MTTAGYWRRGATTLTAHARAVSSERTTPAVFAAGLMAASREEACDSERS